MSDLKTIIESHATQFAQAIIASLKDLSIDDLIRISQAQGGQARSSAPAPSAARPAGPAVRKTTAPAAAPVAASASAPAARKPKKMASGRLARRSLADIDATLDQIVALLRKKPGLRSEQIGSELGLDKKEIPRPVLEGLNRGVLSKAGERRGTTYYAEKRK